MIKCHWSRYGKGKCLKCGCEFWHDFVGNCGTRNDDWYYYYKPIEYNPAELDNPIPAPFFLPWKQTLS